jgi:hypothetical protein
MPYQPASLKGWNNIPIFVLFHPFRVIEKSGEPFFLMFQAFSLDVHW